VRSQPSSTISVVDAVLATCATRPEFAPIPSGSGFKLREYIAASGAANPIHEMITEAHLLFGGDATVACLLSLGIGNPGISSFPSAAEEAMVHRIMRDMMHDCEQRAQEVEQRIGRVGIYFRFSVEQGMQNDHPGEPVDAAWMVAQTEDYLTQHDTGEKLDLFVQIFSAQTGPITLDQLSSFLRQLRALHSTHHFAEHAGGTAASGQLAASVDKLLANQDDTIIAKLKPVDLESGTHATECMEGTRQDILRRIDAWAANIDAPNILWLNGHPGVGKSAITSSLVENWRSSGRLGSSFFFRRERANVMTPNALWRTVAYDLGRRYPSIRKHLVTVLNANEDIPSTSNPDTLFRQLIYETLTANEKTDRENPPIIVVDALDECGGVDGWHSDHRKALMRTLKSWSTLPGRFKLVVSSRAETDIERLFSTTAHHPVEVSAGQQVDPLSSMDIRKFLKHELQQIVSLYPSLPSDWPGDRTIERLADRAAGLFIWVKTVIKLLEHGEPRRTLKQILEGGGAGGMAALYSWILKVSFPNPSDDDVRDFQSILGAIIFTKAPLDAAYLAQLLSMESSTMEYICNGLQSVLDSENAVRIHHQSFVDFLLDPKDCPKDFLIVRERENRNLTVTSLKVMKTHLRFNICELESSYVRNTEVPDLQSRVEKNIPCHLFYSSRFWADHLAQTAFDGEVFEHLQYFMQIQFLFWLEVLSLTGVVNVASGMLWTLLNWIRVSFKRDIIGRKLIHRFRPPTKTTRWQQICKNLSPALRV
jgi:NACHT domain